MNDIRIMGTGPAPRAPGPSGPLNRRARHDCRARHALHDRLVRHGRPGHSPGKTQGFGRQVTPSVVRNFVCCIITGASAPSLAQLSWS